MKTISLTQRKVAVVDVVDYLELSKYNWHALKAYKWYAARNEGGVKNRRYIYMHRQIMNPSSNLMVDHINGNGLDNRRINLRVCNSYQNMHNSGGWKKRKLSKYKGVVHDNRMPINSKRWIARITFHHKVKHIGSFFTEIEAARAYDKAAKELFGEFAFLNFHLRSPS